MLTPGKAGFAGKLQTKVIRGRNPRRVRQIRTPFGRFAWTKDPGEADIFNSAYFFKTNLQAVHRDGDGVMLNEYDLGSGVITAAGALALARDWYWPNGTASTLRLSTLQVANNHATGTSATAAALSDIALNTPSANGGQTMVAGTPTTQFTTAGSLSGTNYPIYQTVATINYTGTETVTEWGLFGNLGAIGGTALSSATLTPFTAGSATTGTLTGTMTASSNTVQGQTLTIFHNTGNATPSWGLGISNTTSVVTVDAWFAVSNAAAGANPANGNAMVVRPLMLDHKVFTGIGVNNGDSIQFTYKLSVNDNT